MVTELGGEVEVDLEERKTDVLSGCMMISERQGFWVRLWFCFVSEESSTRIFRPLGEKYWIELWKSKEHLAKKILLLM